MGKSQEEESIWEDKQKAGCQSSRDGKPMYGATTPPGSLTVKWSPSILSKPYCWSRSLDPHVALSPGHQQLTPHSDQTWADVCGYNLAVQLKTHLSAPAASRSRLLAARLPAPPALASGAAAVAMPESQTGKKTPIASLLRKGGKKRKINIHSSETKAVLLS